MAHRYRDSDQTSYVFDDGGSITEELDYEMKNARKLKTIKFKLIDNGINISKILNACERRDRNKDGYIHIDDFDEVFDDVVGVNTLSRRDRKFLMESCNFDKKYGRIAYMELYNLLELKEEEPLIERWKDDYQEPFPNVHIEPGTIGEWLQKSACPVEIDNYKLFISHLENFERESGMRIKLSKDGEMTVPLGPDLKVKINFRTS